MIATLQEQYCKAHICSDFANERFMDDGLAQDQKFVKALCQWANKAPSTLAREMGLAATTITRPFRGTATTRISAPTFDKLRLRYPDFPGWNNEEPDLPAAQRSEEHTSELQSLMRLSYAVFCLRKQKDTRQHL